MHPLWTLPRPVRVFLWKIERPEALTSMSENQENNAVDVGVLPVSCDFDMTSELVGVHSKSIHAKCPEVPPDKAIIWRYMDIGKFLSMITRSELFFPSIKHLRAIDPYEGAIPEGEIEYLRALEKLHLDSFVEHGAMTKEQRQEAEARQPRYHEMQINRDEFESNFTYVSCWHENESESDAMWRIYGGLTGAVAVQSTFGRLCATVERASEPLRSGMPPDNPRILCGRVKYLDFINWKPPQLWTARYFQKRRPFEMDHEVRAVLKYLPFVASETGNYHFDDARYVVDTSQLREGLSLKIGLRELIAKIHVSPFAPNWIVNPIVDVLKRFELADLADGLSESTMLRKPAYLRST
jgi:hypothetical protein